MGADDWLFPNCIAELSSVAEAHPTVGMVTSYVLVGTKIGWTGLPFPSTVVNGRDICRMRLLDGIRVFGGPSASLLRTEVVKARQPFYTQGNYHGDNEAYLNLLRDHDFGFVHQVLSYNRRDEDSRTTHYLQSFNSDILMIVEELLKFGPVYLSDSEFRDRHVTVVNDYYKFLAGAAFESRGSKFWDTHRERLLKLGTPLDRAKLSRFVVLRFLDLVLNPKRTAESLYKRIVGTERPT